MRIVASDIDEAYSNPACPQYRPVPTGFIASYPPISKAGTEGPFFVNSNLLQPNRYAETVGPVPVRSKDFK